MMDVLAGVLTGSNFADSVVGPFQPEKPSGCGHLLLTIDIAALIPADEFAGRMEQLIDDTKGVEKAAGVDEIFFPGELEDRSSTTTSSTGIQGCAAMASSHGGRTTRSTCSTWPRPSALPRTAVPTWTRWRT